MATSGGFGGPSLPMGDSNMLVAALVLLLIIGAVFFLVTNVLES